MKHFLPLVLVLFWLAVQLPAAAQAAGSISEPENCRKNGIKRDCGGGPAWCSNADGTCSPEMRGRCGKRRGDWYGASQPVVNATEARELLSNYFIGHGYTVSEITEKKWGFRADILDKDGKAIDRVMIDKRSGRIRSLY